jgi:hypothetical protein
MKSNNNNNNDDDDDDDDNDDDNNNNTAMGSVHARGDTFLTFGLKALTETNTSRLTTGYYPVVLGGVMVTVLTTGPQGSWLKPGQERWNFKGNKIHSTTLLQRRNKAIGSMLVFTAC